MSMFTYFDELPTDYLKHLLVWEGGYVNHKNDPGGETNMGITAGALTKAKEMGLVGKSMTVKGLSKDKEAVRKIYNQNYYLAGKCNKIPHPLAFAHFDMCVNSGLGGKSKKGTAIGAGANLQKTIIFLGEKITLDGAVGPLTLKALDRLLERYSPVEICRVYNNFREKYFHAIVESRPQSKVFLKGWLNRLAAVRKFCS